MKNNINYTGGFILKLEEALEKNPDMTIGEVIFSAFHRTNMNGKHYFYADDREMYTALENFCKFTSEEDEKLTDQEFDFWIQKHIVK